jgi:hypothetical protein
MAKTMPHCLSYAELQQIDDICAKGFHDESDIEFLFTMVPHLTRELRGTRKKLASKTYAVYDGGKPARYPECKVDPSWKNNTFETFEEAETYALNWLGDYAPDRGVILLDVPYDYSCCEIPCLIEIRRE